MHRHPRSSAHREAQIAQRIEAWFPAAARTLPWRTRRRDPYHALVAETMLQQTQASRVADRFAQFIARFPTVHDLAAADQRRVLALWSGLGYYARARHLHSAAQRICGAHGGVVPRDPAVLRTLPGVGRYTAGAVASIVFGQREPIVDGNVKRVLLRVEGRRPGAHRAPQEAWLWTRAAALVAASRRPGVLNEGLMELGATVCTPRGPRCAECPLRTLCRGRARVDAPPPPRPKRPALPLLHCASVVIRDASSGRVLVQRRPQRGMWAGLWEAPTLERADRPPRRAEVARLVGLPLSTIPSEPAASFQHKTTHRDVRFEVWSVLVNGPVVAGGGLDRPTGDRRWVQPSRLTSLALSTPQRRILTSAAAPASDSKPRRR